MSRNGLIFFSANFSRITGAESNESNPLTARTTSPRLTGSAVTRAAMEYQLMRANVTPESLSVIQVPPPGSDGESTARPLINFFDGGKPLARVNFSSRFIPSAKPCLRGEKVTVHILVGCGISCRERRIVAPLPPEDRNFCRRATAPVVCRADGED